MLSYTTPDHLPRVGNVYTETLIKFPTNLPTGQCDKFIKLIAVSSLKITQAFVKLPKINLISTVELPNIQPWIQIHKGNAKWIQ